MQNLISIGSPQNGVHQFPKCESYAGPLCPILPFLIDNTIAYLLPLQQSFTPAAYWHDVNDENYRRSSSFLSTINNERDYNPAYVQNLQKLKRLVLVKYTSEEVVVPAESSWFGYIDANGNAYPMEQTRFYRENRLGLQEMNANGKLIRLLAPGVHNQFDPAWLAQNIIPYLMEV